MDKRRTEDSLMALAIYNTIKDINEPFLRVYDVAHPAAVREGIRRNIRFHGAAQEISMTIKNGNLLYVGTKQKAREQRLADMVRKMLLHVDDEQLYDEALELLGGLS